MEVVESQTQITEAAAMQAVQAAQTAQSVHKLEMYRLLPLCSILRKLESFSRPVIAVNFTMRKGWGGKTYVAEHGVSDYNPATRACDLLDVYYLNRADCVILTAEQWADFNVFSI